MTIALKYDPIDDKWLAYIADPNPDHRLYGEGRRQDQAIGDLVQHYPEQFNMKIEVVREK